LTHSSKLSASDKGGMIFETSCNSFIKRALGTSRL
jgi:hypothetical protein